VQVGAFGTEAAARQAAVAARRVVDAGEAKVEPVTINKKTSYRAQLVGMTQAEMQGACGALVKKKFACVPVRPEGAVVAGR
jgi:hypothetical protein